MSRGLGVEHDIAVAVEQVGEACADLGDRLSARSRREGYELAAASAELGVAAVIVLD